MTFLQIYVLRLRFQYLWPPGLPQRPWFQVAVSTPFETRELGFTINDSPARLLVDRPEWSLD